MDYQSKAEADQPAALAIIFTTAGVIATPTESRCPHCQTQTFDARIPCHECARIQKRAAN